jgi:hypothetical protein
MDTVSIVNSAQAFVYKKVLLFALQKRGTDLAVRAVSTKCREMLDTLNKLLYINAVGLRHFCSPLSAPLFMHCINK